MNFALNQSNLPWNWNVYYFFFGQVKPRSVNVVKRKSKNNTVGGRYSLIRSFYYEHGDNLLLLLSGFMLDCVVASMPLPKDEAHFIMQCIMTFIGAYARRRYLYLDDLLFKEVGSVLMLAVMFITGHTLMMSVFTMLISAYLTINSNKRKPLVQTGIEISLVCLILLMAFFEAHPFTVLYATLTSVFAPFSIMFYLIMWCLTFKPEVTSTTSSGNDTSITSNDTTLVPAIAIN